VPDLTLNSLLPDLRAGTMADLTWWTEAELYRYANNQLQELARALPCWVKLATFSTSFNDVATYALPARTVDVLGVYLDGRRLDPMTADELDAERGAWRAAGGETPRRYTLDLTNSQIILSEIPGAAYSVIVIYTESPAEISSGAAIVAGPAALADLVQLATIQQAYTRQSESAMPDVASAANLLRELVMAGFGAYYGGN
jgi:hypothetical protein